MTAVTSRTPWVLGWTEARRLVVHPAYLAGVALVVPVMGVRAVTDVTLPSARAVFEFTVGAQLVWYGLVSLLAAGMAASLARRSHAEEVLQAQPASTGARAAAHCLAVLLGPAAVSVLVTAGMWSFERGQEQPFGSFSGTELVQVPFVVLGGGLLGVLAARWLPWRGGLLVALVATVVVTGWVLGQGRYGWLAPWTAAQPVLDDPDFTAGSQGWHAAYLAGLCLLAGLAVCIADVRRTRAWWATAALALAATAAAGWAQLP